MRTQRSSTRYLHRPDATHLSVDSTATSMMGYYAMVDIAKLAGSVGAKVALAFASPGYEVNDMGFQSASDRIILDTNFNYDQNRPGRYFRSWRINGGPDAIWNYGGERIFAEFNAMFTSQWTSYRSASMRLAYNPPTDDDRLTRGGPLALTPRRYSGNANFSTDSRKSTGLRLSQQWSTDDGGAWHTGFGVNLTSRPRESLDFRMGPSFTRRHTSAQFVSSVADPLAEETFGRRYVFAGLDQTTVSLETRMNVTFTPALSFELYVEPFVSTGSYGGFKEFRAPGTFDFLEYGREVGTVEPEGNGFFRVDPDGAGPAGSFLLRDQDFTRLSLLGNAVMRWEWRPGSTLFLVWQQSRSDALNLQNSWDDRDRIGQFDLGRDAGDLFRLRADNIFVIKVNYWFNP